MEGEQNYFCVIPTELIESGDLTKACLFGLISSYAKKSGECWASNKTLAEKIGRTSESTISRKISQLVQEGYLTISISKELGNRRLLAIGIGKKDKTYTQKKQDPYMQKKQDSNNTMSNINSNNTTNVVFDKSRKQPNPDLQELINYAESLNFVLQGNQQSNRFSAFNVLKKYGLEKSKKAVEMAVGVRGKPYAPTINDFASLYRKIGDLINFYQKEKNERNNRKPIIG